MSKLEEMVETFDDARGEVDRKAGWFERDKAGLLAVFDKHVKPMLADEIILANSNTSCSIGRAAADARAERVISELRKT